MIEAAQHQAFGSRDEWLEARHRGIGGSDAAAAIGLNRWKAPLAVYCDKLGIGDPDNELSEPAEWGLLLEPVLIEKYRSVTGRRVQTPSGFELYRSPHHPFMSCTPDGLITDPERDGEGVLEAKTGGVFTLKEWKEEPPLEYQVQLQHNMAVLDLKWGSFAVLIGGQRFFWCDMERNDRFCEVLVRKEADFWERVVTGTPPDPDASTSTSEAIARLYPGETGRTIDLDDEASEWNRRHLAIKEAKKRLELQERLYGNRLRAAIGEATFGRLPDGSRLSLKTVKKEPFMVTPSPYRELRRLKPQ